MRSVRHPHVRPVVAFLLLGLGSLAPRAEAAGTFGYRQQFTLSGVLGGPHIDFPVLISVVDLNLRSTGNGGHVESANGYDMVFTASDGTTPLDHEIERWDGATGELVAWVRLPSLSAGTVIYLYYGNSQISSATETPGAVWESSYVGVWHLAEAGSGAINEYRDSSRYGNHGRGGKGIATAVPSQVAGAIGFGAHFDNADGNYDFIDAGDDGTLNVTGNQITFETWLKHNITIDAAHGTPPLSNVPYGILNHKGYNDGYSLWLLGNSFLCPGGPVTEPCVVFNLPGRDYSLRTPQTAPMGPNVWHHVVATFDGGTMTLFVDGTNQGTLAKAGNIPPSNAEQPMWIGHGDQPQNVTWSGQYEGELDEIRISRSSRSANWVATAFANQSSPGTFESFGVETPVATSLSTFAVNYRSVGTNPGVLYSTGDASVGVGTTNVTFAGGASLPGNVGAGDVLTFTGAPAETLFILSRDSATQVTLQSPATSSHTNQTYTITRAFNSLGAWETGRGGNLKGENRREVGVAYNDGAFTGATISGSTTDPVRNMTLTAPQGQSHLGRAGTGVVVDNGASLSPAIQITDDYVTVEWLEIKGGSGVAAHGVELGSGINPANRAMVRYNIIHDTGGDGVSIGDSDSIADIYNNVIYEASHGVHLPLDMAADARVNLFNNTVYGCNAAPGPSGIKSSVRQTSVRVDLRNNIAHSNANGDFGVAPFFDRGYFCDPGCAQIGNGGVLGPNEFLADRTNDATLSFTTVGTSCLYLGSSSKFRGLDYVRATAGVVSGVSLQWTYWNGASWANLGPFSDGTDRFRWSGAVYWPDDPPGWATTSVAGSPLLYYVSACLAAGSYTTLPVESLIVRTDVSTASRNNLSSDHTGFAHSFVGGGGTGLDLVPLGSMSFFDTTPGTEDLHIAAGSAAEDVAFDLTRLFTGDIDGGLRLAPWDIGADDVDATTAVVLRSFGARGDSSAVELTWETSSELDNLGFHLYRSSKAEGPFARITSALIPGLGSSPVGASYRYRDEGLTEGVTYYYELEDVDTTGKGTRHGPVSAATDEASSNPEGVDSSSSLTYGEPSATVLRVVSRDARQMVLELTTPGFYGEPQDDGSVRLSIPGFVVEGEAGSPALPLRRSLLDLGPSFGVRIVSVRTEAVEWFSSLRPSAVDAPDVFAARSGIVRAARRRQREGAGFRTSELHPAEAAKLVSVGYEGESRKALLELAPLRWDGALGRLVLARRLTVRLSFDGPREARHRESATHRSRNVTRRLLARERGLYGVSYDQVGSGPRGVPASSLRLSRLGESVAYHLEPDVGRFGPGSILYFVSEGESLNPYGREAVYELETGVTGTGMRVVPAAPSGAAVSNYWQEVEREENRYYQAGLLEAEDLWLWDLLFAPVKKTYSFRVDGPLDGSKPARLEMRLQGVSDMLETPDHHLRFAVNGVSVGETAFEGKKPLTFAADVPAGALLEGDNGVEVENVGDTGAAYSMVMLDRFSVFYPRGTVSVEGRLEGGFLETGAALVEGLGLGSLALDVSETEPLWLKGGEVSHSGLRLRVEAGRKYLLASRGAVKRPSVVWPKATSLKSDRNRADYLVLGPKDLLDVARPLLDWRRSQGLETLAVAVDDVYSEFGFGEPRPEAVHEFLAYAYHHWRKPAPRYVLLLGDGTYDFKDYLGTGVENQVPPLLVKTSYLWTASDPAFAAVNGDDILPDLAIGRLPAASPEEARAMVEKILAYEKLGADPTSPFVVVADNPDAAGDFEAHAESIVTALPPSSIARRIYLGRLGTEAARSEILDAFDQGASILSYVGHGGIHLWASENIFDSVNVPKLKPQALEPLVLTLNCLNGYFHFPYGSSLAEELVEAPGKGAIAAFSPTGLSLDEPAHLFHQAIVSELASGRHERLGDAIAAAQARYAASGAFPELLSIYHLLGDPALKLH